MDGVEKERNKQGLATKASNKRSGDLTGDSQYPIDLESGT